MHSPSRKTPGDTLQDKEWQGKERNNCSGNTIQIFGLGMLSRSNFSSPATQRGILQRADQDLPYFKWFKIHIRPKLHKKEAGKLCGQRMFRIRQQEGLLKAMGLRRSLKEEEERSLRISAGSLFCDTRTFGHVFCTEWNNLTTAPSGRSGDAHALCATLAPPRWLRLALPTPRAATSPAAGRRGTARALVCFSFSCAAAARLLAPAPGAARAAAPGGRTVLAQLAP